MRFDAEQEQEVGRAIRMAEMCTRDALCGIDSAEAILRNAKSALPEAVSAAKHALEAKEEAIKELEIA